MLIKKTRSVIQFVEGFFPGKKEQPRLAVKSNSHPIRYVNLKQYRYPTNSLLVSMVEQTKMWLSHGVEIRFFNVSTEISSRIKQLGLEDVLICDN